MSNVIPFPLNICYRVDGISRGGRIIVKKLNSDEQFLMYADTLVKRSELLRQFPKNQVKWLCDLVAHESGEGYRHC